jgi:hypothetical protein
MILKGKKMGKQISKIFVIYDLKETSIVKLLILQYLNPVNQGSDMIDLKGYKRIKK